MIKFKDLLLEVDNKTLTELLENDYIIPDRLLIRGSDKQVEKFKQFEIRKDREPRDTSRSTNDIIAALEDGYYPTRPKRRESKFATVKGKFEIASKFGSNTHFVFPHKTSNIVSFPQDSIDYIKGLGPGYKRFVKQYLDQKKFPVLHGLVEIYSDIKNFDTFFFSEQKGIKHNDLYSFIKQNWLELKEEVRNLDRVDVSDEDVIGGSKVGRTANRVIENYQTWVSGFENYFSEMMNGVPSGQKIEEVMFDGPKYLSVNLEFLQRNTDLV